MKLYLATLLLAVLAACGGGDPETDQPTPGVSCNAHPEQCV